MTRILRNGAPFLLLLLDCSGRLDVGAKPSSGGSDTGGSALGTSGGDPGTGGASGGESAVPGLPGYSCIKGELSIEARGTPAETAVKTLARCIEGYACSPDSLCVPSEPCASDTRDVCRAYGTAAVGGRPGTGGAPGTGGNFFNGGAYAGDPAVPQPQITGMATRASNLYWIGYGTRDQLGNYNRDGSLRALSLEDGSTATLATELPGPVTLGVTDAHAYVIVDGAPLIGSPTHLRLLRIPLSGGSPEFVQDAPLSLRYFGGFVASGSLAFWVDREELYTMASGDSSPSVFLKEWVGPLVADERYLYFRPAAEDAIRRVPVTGGASEEVVSPTYALGLQGDFVYGIEPIENGSAVMLVRAHTAGDTWLRVRALGAGSGPSKFQIVGDRYFIGSQIPGPYVPNVLPELGVLTGLLSSDSPPTRVLQRAARGTLIDTLWVGTEKALFWSDGDNIYSRAIEP
jgi:hypothetical protein